MLDCETEPETPRAEPDAAAIGPSRRPLTDDQKQRLRRKRKARRHRAAARRREQIAEAGDVPSR